MSNRNADPWMQCLREQGIPDDLIEDAQAAAARMTAAIDFFHRDPTNPLGAGIVMDLWGRQE